MKGCFKMNNFVNNSINDFYNSIDYSKPISQYASEFDFSRVESFFYKIIFILFAIIVFKIIVFYTLNKLKISVKKNKSFYKMNVFEQYFALKNIKNEHIEEKTNSAIEIKSNTKKKKDDVEIIVKNQSEEIQELSAKARVMFTSAIKSKQLNRDEIVAIRTMLRKNTNKINKKYENDAHEICSRLKHYSISEKAILSVIDFLEVSYDDVENA